MNNRDHDELLSQATDRFERRLSEECGKQRMDTAQLRVETMKGDAEIRAAVADLRLDMTEQLGAMRIESATRHRELLKWAWMLWVGQATAIAGVIGAVGYFFARR